MSEGTLAPQSTPCQPGTPIHTRTYLSPGEKSLLGPERGIDMAKAWNGASVREAGGSLLLGAGRCHQTEGVHTAWWPPATDSAFTVGEVGQRLGEARDLRVTPTHRGQTELRLRRAGGRLPRGLKGGL